MNSTRGSSAGAWRQLRADTNGQQPRDAASPRDTASDRDLSRHQQPTGPADRPDPDPVDDSCHELLALRDGVRLAITPDEQLWLLCGVRRECFGPDTAGRRSILRELADGRTTVARLTSMSAGPNNSTGNRDSTDNDDSTCARDSTGNTEDSSRRSNRDAEVLPTRAGDGNAEATGRANQVAEDNGIPLDSVPPGELPENGDLDTSDPHNGDLHNGDPENGDLDDVDLEAAEFIGRLRAGGWLNITVACHGNDVYTLLPHQALPSWPAATEDRLRLSRFAVVRRDGDNLLVESPRASCDVRLHDPAALTVLGQLDESDRPYDVGSEPDSAARLIAGALPVTVIERLRADLRLGGLAVPTPSEEDTDPRFRQWTATELRFHQQTRYDAARPYGLGYGRTMWARECGFDPLPARPEPYGSPPIPLARPDPERLRTADPPFGSVLEDRRTIRRHDDENPLSLRDLGEFLFRSGRVRESIAFEGVEYVRKPYPAGGSVGELEIYPVVRLMRDLEPAMYHYDAFDHALRLVRPVRHPAVQRLLRSAATSSIAGEVPQVLLVITARVGRQLWQYEAVGYAMMLKHTGVLYQTMYLVATAMGLAACGLGGGDRTAFNHASGRDPYDECGIGEFMLGSPSPRDGEESPWRLGPASPDRGSR